MANIEGWMSRRGLGRTGLPVNLAACTCLLCMSCWKANQSKLALQVLSLSGTMKDSLSSSTSIASSLSGASSSSGESSMMMASSSSLYLASSGEFSRMMTSSSLYMTELS